MPSSRGSRLAGEACCIWHTITVAKLASNGISARLNPAEQAQRVSPVRPPGTNHAGLIRYEHVVRRRMVCSYEHSCYIRPICTCHTGGHSHTSNKVWAWVRGSHCRHATPSCAGLQAGKAVRSTPSMFAGNGPVQLALSLMLTGCNGKTLSRHSSSHMSTT